MYTSRVLCLAVALGVLCAAAVSAAPATDAELVADATLWGAALRHLSMVAGAARETMLFHEIVLHATRNGLPRGAWAANTTTTELRSYGLTQLPFPCAVNTTTADTLTAVANVSAILAGEANASAIVQTIHDAVRADVVSVAQCIDDHASYPFLVRTAGCLDQTLAGFQSGLIAETLEDILAAVRNAHSQADTQFLSHVIGGAHRFVHALHVHKRSALIHMMPATPADAVYYPPHECFGGSEFRPGLGFAGFAGSDRTVAPYMIMYYADNAAAHAARYIRSDTFATAFVRSARRNGLPGLAVNMSGAQHTEWAAEYTDGPREVQLVPGNTTEALCIPTLPGNASTDGVLIEYTAQAGACGATFVVAWPATAGLMSWAVAPGAAASVHRVVPATVRVEPLCLALYAACATPDLLGACTACNTTVWLRARVAAIRPM